MPLHLGMETEYVFLSGWKRGALILFSVFLVFHVSYGDTSGLEQC
jgi:hypothetical protein